MGIKYSKSVTSQEKASPAFSAEASTTITIQPHNRAPAHIDIDTEKLHQDYIPSIQLALVDFYLTEEVDLYGEDSKIGKHVVDLLRRVVVKFRPKSSSLALEKLAKCYRDGVGIPKDSKMANTLEDLCRAIGPKLDREDFCQELKSWFEGFNGSPEPELRLLEMAAGNGDLLLNSVAMSGPNVRVHGGEAGPS